MRARSPGRKWLLATLAGLFWPLAMAAGAAPADAACGQQAIRVELSQQPLRLALGDVAERLGFELEYSATANPLVSGEYHGRPVDVVRRLVEPVSSVLMTRTDPACRGEVQLVRVVVLPDGEDAPLPTREHVSQPIQNYRRAHGLDPLTGEPLRRSSGAR